MSCVTSRWVQRVGRCIRHVQDGDGDADHRVDGAMRQAAPPVPAVEEQVFGRPWCCGVVVLRS